jgi:hypothetical protein
MKTTIFLLSFLFSIILFADSVPVYDGFLSSFVQHNHTDKQDALVASREIWVDSNRAVTYTPDGTVAKPFRSLSAALSTVTSAASVHLVTGSYSETGTLALPAYPLVVYGNGSSLSLASATIQADYTAYDLNVSTSGTDTFNGGSTAHYRLINGTQTGNITLTTGELDIQNRSMLSGTVTVDGGVLQTTYTVWTAQISQTGGTIIIDKCNWNTNKSTALLISTAGQLSVSNTVIVNGGSGGGISCANGATAAAPNSIMNVAIITLSGTAFTSSTAFVSWSKNSLVTAGVAAAPSSLALIPVSFDVIGPSAIVIGSDATGDMYYRAATGVLTRIPIGISGQVLKLNSSLVPTWTTP